MQMNTYASRWVLLTAMVISAGATAQQKSALGDLPPPGSMTAQMPDGMDLYIGLAVSDARQSVASSIGSTPNEAKIRARKECEKVGGTCAELATLPVRNHCMAVVADRGAKPNVRAIFITAAEASSVKPGELSTTSMAQCKASGAKQCEVQNDYCF